MKKTHFIGNTFAWKTKCGKFTMFHDTTIFKGCVTCDKCLELINQIHTPKDRKSEPIMTTQQFNRDFIELECERCGHTIFHNTTSTVIEPTVCKQCGGKFIRISLEK